MAGIICLEIGLLMHLYQYIINKYDKEPSLDWNGKWADFLGLGCILAGGMIGYGLKHWGIGGQLSCGLLAAYLLVGSAADLQTYKVYDFLPAVTALAGAGLLMLTGDQKVWNSLFWYILLQFGVFAKMYGRADVYAFLVCALFECRFGKGLQTYLWHMCLTFLLVAAVQFAKGNINRCGNLRRPIALLPYISLTVWCFL